MQAHAKEEVQDLATVAGGLLVNIGTLDPAWVESMELAIATCRGLGKPWVLDPVAAGATPYRTGVAAQLLKLRPSVVRGNAGEILAISGVAGAVRGTDAVAGVEAAESAARDLAVELECVVAVSGPVDYVRRDQLQPCLSPLPIVAIQAALRMSGEEWARRRQASSHRVYRCYAAAAATTPAKGASSARARPAAGPSSP